MEQALTNCNSEELADKFTKTSIGGRIPLVTREVDNLPQAWISLEQAGRLATAFREISDELLGAVSRINHYRSSAGHLVECLRNYKGEDKTEAEHQHIRLLGGCLREQVLDTCIELEARIQDIKLRLESRSKSV